jgi:hypothetical protein
MIIRGGAGMEETTTRTFNVWMVGLCFCLIFSGRGGWAVT